MGRNQKEIELFGEKFILSERNAFDVLSFSEFAKNNTEDKTIGISLYQAALIIESALKYNKKELPSFNSNIFRKVLQFFGLDKKYKQFLKQIEEILEYNRKLTSNYILSNLTQVELFQLMKEVYILEGAKFSTEEGTDTEKKS